MILWDLYKSWKMALFTDYVSVVHVYNMQTL